MDELFREYIEVREELEDISLDRKERNIVLKGLQEDIQQHLEKDTPNGSKIIDQYKISLSEVKITKALNAKTLVIILTEYFNGDKQKAENLSSYIWNNREVEIKKQIKVSKPRNKKKVNTNLT